MKEELTNSDKAGKNFMLPIVIAALIIFAVIGFFVFKPLSNNPKNEQLILNEVQTEEVTPSVTVIYKDGSYTATGNYVSPGGPREIDLTIVISGDKVVESTFVGKATDPTSQRFQGEFGDNYKEMIVGKKIDELNLSKVSGSSLTSKGFNDALQKIKSEAEG